MVQTSSTAAAGAALGTAAFEAALRGPTFGRASRAALEATAPRAAARGCIAPGRSAAGTVIIATGTEWAISLRLARTVVSALAGAEGALTLARARTILAFGATRPEGPFAGGTPRPLVIPARRAFSTLAAAAG